mmetsp:Transcript_97408/g.303346  ORF Transcript_97408/g.303346 Transcript_97408/m.303346 type:complete len:333 (+) Transcript_97408:73-1071(+)
MARITMMFLAWCCLLQHLGTSLRMPPADGPFSDSALPEDAASASLSLPRTILLPSSPSEFARVWQMRYKSEHRLTEPMPSNVQLVLGIFTQPWQTEYRKVMRQTWLNQTGVCLWRAGSPASHCSVHVAFVYGNRGQGTGAPPGVDVSLSNEAAARAEPGSFVLNIEETMNGGKTFVWFQAAAKAFPWATHIAKCDMDAYPFLHKLIKKMSDRARMGPTPYEYAGAPAYVRNKSFSSACTPHQSEKGYDLTFRGQYFSHMSGSLYILSQRLVETLVRPSGWWAANPGGGHEDMKTSMAIEIAAAEHGFCVSTWNTGAHYHGGDQVSEVYANSF